MRPDFGENTKRKLENRKSLDLLPRAPPARFNLIGFRHPTSAKFAAKW